MAEAFWPPPLEFRIMYISQFLRRVFSLVAIFCLFEGDAPAQTITREVPLVQSANASNSQSAPAFSAPTSTSADPYTTMCVRSCDGFYFPLRQNAHPEFFARDAQTCASECGSEARLFYFPLYGGNPATMIDLAGRKYAEEPNAFAFRKAVTAGCACKPAPWSKEAAERHRKYVAEEKARRAEQTTAEAAKASAAISAAAAREYYESDAGAQK